MIRGFVKRIGIISIWLLITANIYVGILSSEHAGNLEIAALLAYIILKLMLELASNLKTATDQLTWERI